MSIDNIAVKQVSSDKSLAILIDENLMWHSQIDKVTKKIASGIGAIEQIRSFAQPCTLRYIYNALVQLHFSYRSAVWKIAVKRYQPEISYKKKKERAAPLLLLPVMMLMLGSYYNNCVGKI